MPEWHTTEKAISKAIRIELKKGLSRESLMELDNIKGYREVRYRLASKYLGQSYV